jgi:hypothetical protein
MSNVRRAARGQISGGFFIERERGLKKDEGEKVGAMKNRNLLFLYILFTMIFSLNLPAAFSGTATLSWDAPTTNADGTPLTDLAGYMVYYGNSPGNYFQNMNVDNVTTYTVNNLTDGLTYYFAVTAYDTLGNESRYSNEISKTIQLPQYTLTINKCGAGEGTVTSSPTGINCGSDCSEVYNAGTVAILTALPSADSTFAGWSNGGCTGTGQCVITINLDTSVTATFIRETYSITTIAGAGGSISPSGSVSVNYSANQTFTIIPDRGYRIVDVKIDGASFGAISAYTFSNITNNHIIEANFIGKNSIARRKQR